MAKISVIVPVYNTAPFLKRCFSSLERQTVDDIEFILVDDKSTDGSLNIIEEYQSKDSRFKIISLPENEGVSVARNKGIEASTGKYIGFVDSDDYIDPDYFETLATAIEESKIKIAMSNSIELDKKPKEIIDFTESKTSLTEGGASSCMRLFERELIGDDRFIEHCRFEDSAFTFLMHMKSRQMIISKYSEYYYCNDNEDSFSKTEWYSLQSILDSMTVIDFLQEKVTNNIELSLYQEKIDAIGLTFLFDSAEYIKMSNLTKEKKIDLLSHLEVLIDKKYSNIKDDITTFGSIILNKYARDTEKQKYIPIDKVICENSFKCKVKSLIN